MRTILLVVVLAAAGILVVPIAYILWGFWRLGRHLDDSHKFKQ
jgi:hypothetical protein